MINLIYRVSLVDHHEFSKDSTKPESSSEAVKKRVSLFILMDSPSKKKHLHDFNDGQKILKCDAYQKRTNI